MGAIPKVLVCITPQTNCRRLIDKGIDIARQTGAELHILHVERGYNIFQSDASPLVLQELFDYGARQNGIVHAICGEDVCRAIIDFIREHRIGTLVLGVTPETVPLEMDMARCVRKMMPHLEIIVQERVAGHV